MITYSDDFFNKQSKEVLALLKFLQECKLAGSYETKLDLNHVIKLLFNQDNVIKQLRQELNNKEIENKKLLEKIK